MTPACIRKNAQPFARSHIGENSQPPGSLPFITARIGTITIGASSSTGICILLPQQRLMPRKLKKLHHVYYLQPEQELLPFTRPIVKAMPVYSSNGNHIIHVQQSQLTARV